MIWQPGSNLGTVNLTHFKVFTLYSIDGAALEYSQVYGGFITDDLRI
jgi:hypothetical protein